MYTQCNMYSTGMIVCSQIEIIYLISSLSLSLSLSLSIDMHRQMHRLGVPHNEPVNHPQKTVNAMRLLAAITDNSLRASVSHALYKV